MTKNPTIAPSAPATSVVAGAPRAAAERAGSTYLATVPTSSSTVSTPRTIQRAGPPPSAIVHHSPAPQISSSPGSTGSSTPTRPATISAPTSSSSPPVIGPALPRKSCPPPGPTPGRLGASAAAHAGPRSVRRADAGQVQRQQQQPDEQQRLRRERVPEVGVGPVQDQCEAEDHRGGESEHRKLLQEVDPRATPGVSHLGRISQTRRYRLD